MTYPTVPVKDRMETYVILPAQELAAAEPVYVDSAVDASEKIVGHN
jgi:hypothetical protein